jgi:cytochrome c oxidase subunit 2
VVFPVVVLTALWVLVLEDMRALSQPAQHTLTVDVVGHQWWWEVRYPEQRIVTANEVHIPSGQPVLIRLTTDDVIHSFWVPQLTGKLDLISGRVNHLTVEADHPGVYRGQCAEFCGLQHALMIFYVVAHSPADFSTWVANETRPGGAPSSALGSQGLQVFLSSACSACHAIQGVNEPLATGSSLTRFGIPPPSTAVEGPDLTHFGSRMTIGAGAVTNTDGALGGWIVNSQAIKPGNYMPPVQVSPADLQALIAYLESLK